MITLSQLAIYPIKSTAQIALSKATMSPFGLDNDRRWMLIDDSGFMLTQRKYPKMCLIQCRCENDQLLVSAPNMPVLKIPREGFTKDNNTRIKATVWDDSCDVYNCGTAAAEWFSGFLGSATRLVYFPENEIRQVDLTYAKRGDITAFSDGFPYLLISQASLDDLNSRLQSPVEMKRFRPNLVIAGCDAFAEDSWKKIRIGDITLDLVKPCSRCVIPSINPDTAEKSAEVVKTLADYRMRDNKIFFGQNVIATNNGELAVGMPVEILA